MPEVKDLPQVEDDLCTEIRLRSFPDGLCSTVAIEGTSNCCRLREWAAAAVAPELFAKLGARIPEEFAVLNMAPDGRNINDNCGALHPEWVAAEVQRRGASIGVTFDGDADRCMLAGAQGNVINGDAILLMAGRDLKARGLLSGDVVVATTMSNMGLEAAFKRSGIRMLRAPVGDRYVLEQMQQNNAALGGEQSGHILFPHLATTGDGLLTALVVLDLVARSGKSIDELDRRPEGLSAGDCEREGAGKETAGGDSGGCGAHSGGRRRTPRFRACCDSLLGNGGSGARDDRGGE